MAYFILKEKISRYDVAQLTIGFLGVIIISDPIEALTNTGSGFSKHD